MRLYTQQKQAKFTIQYQLAAIEGLRLALIAQVTSAYFTLIAQLEQLKLLYQLDSDLNALIRLSENDIKIGLKNEIDVAQLKSDEQLVFGQIKPVLHNIVVSENSLRYLTNQNPGKVRYKNNFAKIDFTRFKPSSLPATVLNNRPDLRMAISAFKSTKMGILVAYSDFFPAIQLDQFVGRASSSRRGLAQLTDSYLDWNIMPSSLGKASASKGAYEAQFAEYIKTIRLILKEVDNGFSANKRMNEQFLAYSQAEKEYYHKYQLQENLLKIGLISYKELLASKVYLDGLLLSTNQIKLELAMSLVFLYQDLAGGYAYNEN